MSDNNFNNNTELDDLRMRLEGLDVGTKKLNELIQERNSDVRYFMDLLYALDFVDFSRKLYFEEGDCSFYDYISDNMYRYKQDKIQSKAVRLINKKRDS